MGPIFYILPRASDKSGPALDTAMGEKVTEMLLKVHDLECSKCYKKVKKILSKFPQIQETVYDEKKNTVIIKVVCCCPEKIRDKICCKGRGIIKSIEILKPAKKPPEGKKDCHTTPIAAAAANATANATANAPEVKIEDKTSIVVNFFDLPKPPKEHKTPEKPKPPEEPKKLAEPKTSEKPKKPEESKTPEKPKTHEVNIKDKNTIEVNFFDVPKPCYCGRNCDGYCGRPVYCSCGCGGYGGNCVRPVNCSCGCGGHGGNCVRPVNCSCGCGRNRGNCRRPVYCSCGCGGYRGNCGSRCSEYYFIEDNSQGCSII